MSERDVPIKGHDYDGIQELNNPLPKWWLATFVGAIIFAIVSFHCSAVFTGLTGLAVFRSSALLLRFKESRSVRRTRWNQVNSRFQFEPERSWAKSMAKPRTWRRW